MQPLGTVFFWVGKKGGEVDGEAWGLRDADKVIDVAKKG